MPSKRGRIIVTPQRREKPDYMKMAEALVAWKAREAESEEPPPERRPRKPRKPR
jgi:hypothetical protein